MTAFLHSVVATSAVLVTGVPTAVAAPADPGVVANHERLRELAPDGPFGSARALGVLVSHDSTLAILQVRGIDRSVAGRSFGAHLHAGPCIAGDGAAAGPHYNTDTIAGKVPPRVDPTTEIWLDFTVTPSGAANALTVVPFTPLPGNRSIVIHAQPTDHHGTAGPRLACLPLSW